jgi:cytochrome b
MAAEPETIATSSGTKKNPASIRLWHWLNAIVITGSLLTVLLNSTLLKTRNNAAFIKAQLSQNGANVTDTQAREAAHALSDKVWDIHTYIGYCLAALLLFRLFAEFFLHTDRKLIRTIKNAYHQYDAIKQHREAILNEFWIKTIYAVFYLLLSITAITGLCLAINDDFPALKKLHFIKEIHELNMYLILAFIVIHIAGVFLAERNKNGKGIVSDMINGG